MEIIKFNILLLVSYFNTLSKLKNKRSISLGTLISTKSYRIVKGDNASIIFMLRCAKRAITQIWLQQQCINYYERENNSAIYDGSSKFLNDRVNYINSITKEVVSLGISRSTISLKGNLIFKMFLTIDTLFSLVIFLFIGILKKRNNHLALILIEKIEIIYLCKILRKHKINKLYFFCSYEKDANFTVLLLNIFRIKVFRIPSANPLKYFYKDVVSDVFCFTTPYQQYELKNIDSNWEVDNYYNWPLPNFLILNEFIKNGQSSCDNKGTLGYISSGLWRRLERGTMISEDLPVKCEEMLIKTLQHFVKTTGKKLLIYLHPIEKENLTIYELAKDYYRKAISNNIEFSSLENTTYSEFYKTDLCVSAASTTNIERLYCGYKTFYAPINLDYLLFPGSSLNNICYTSESDLINNLNEAFEMSTDDFFNYYKIQEFRFKS